MKDMDNDTRPPNGRVLRAADVVPPYNDEVPPSGIQGRGVKRPPCTPGRSAESKGEQRIRYGRRTGAGDGTGQPTAGPSGVPMYDLAENILAEHRQIAARRRKGPGRAQVNAETPPVEPTAGAPVGPSSSPDLPETQRIVAQIVARDIERLCKGPARPSELQ